MTHSNPLWSFVGRSDVFAEQSKSGAYYPVRRPLTDGDIEEHLAGLWSIGTYTITPVGDIIPDAGKFYVNYVVFDLDTYDEKYLHVLMQCVEWACDPDAEAYPYLMLEKSGGKGYHIWLFFDGRVEAYRARAWLDENFWPLYRSREYSVKGLEVFPKQDSVSEGGLGNLTKMPFGVHAVSGKKSELVGYHGWVSAVSNIRGMSRAVIPEYEQAQPKVREAITATTPTGILLANGPVSRLIQGEVAKGERNAAFHSFFTWTAWNIHLPSDLAWEWCERLNEALPEPEGDDDQIRKTMDSAYARPPADAASPRPTRGPAPHSAGYRELRRAERLVADARKGG